VARLTHLADTVFAPGVAKRAGLTVLRYDRGFVDTATVTGQAVEAVVPLGSP
jgi:hypothetical protein